MGAPGPSGRLAAGAQQLGDPQQGGAGLLELLDLARDHPQGAEGEPGVGVDEEGGAQSDRALGEEVSRGAEHHPRPCGVDEDGHRPLRGVHHPGPHPGLVARPGALVEAVHDVPRGPAGADVLRAPQALFEEAEQLGAGLPEGPPVGHGEALDGEQQGQSQGDEGGVREGHQPQLEPQGQQHPRQQQDVGHDLQHEEGEEVGQVGHVAVDALDQLAGGALLMEPQVEGQAVPGQVCPQPVGGRPAHPLPRVGGPDGQQLLGHGDGHEEARPPGQPRRGVSGVGLESLRWRRR